jgi:hypothetical protein
MMRGSAKLSGERIPEYGGKWQQDTYSPEEADTGRSVACAEKNQD